MKSKSLHFGLIFSWLRLFNYLEKKIKILWFCAVFSAIFLGISEVIFLSKISGLDNFLSNNDLKIGVQLILISTIVFILRLINNALNIILSNNLFTELNNKLLFILYNHQKKSEDFSGNIVYIYTHILRVISKASNQIMEGLASIFVMCFLIFAVLNNIENNYKPFLVLISIIIILGPQRIISPIIKDLNKTFNNFQIQIIQRLKSIEKNVFYDVIHDRDHLIRYWMNDYTVKARRVDGLTGFVGGLPRLFIEYMIIFLPVIYIMVTKFIKNDGSITNFDYSYLLIFGYAVQRIIPLTSKIVTAISSLIGSGFEVKHLLRILHKSNTFNSRIELEREFGKVKITNIEFKNLFIDNFSKNGLKIKDMKLYPGDILIIKGISGSGKTSFLDTLSGIKDPFSGQIIFNFTHKDGIQKSTNYVTRKMLVYLSQHFDLDIVPGEKFSKDLWRYYSEMLNVENIFDRFQKSKFQDMGEMSGGQQQRFLMSKLFSLDRDLLVLDEPSSALDNVSEQLLIKLIKQESKNRKIFVIVTHSENLSNVGNKFITFDSMDN